MTLSKGYVISAITVTDSERYAGYRQLSTQAIEAWGGKLLVRGGTSEVLEGTFGSRIVVVEFADFATARAFYHGADYSRVGAADANMVVAEGV